MKVQTILITTASIVGLTCSALSQEVANDGPDALTSVKSTLEQTALPTAEVDTSAEISVPLVSVAQPSTTVAATSQPVTDSTPAATVTPNSQMVQSTSPQTPEVSQSLASAPASTVQAALPAATTGLPTPAAALSTEAAPAAPVYAARQNDPLVRAAALYGTYHSEVTDVKTRGFTSASDIEKSLKNLGGHNPDQLTQGWLAYAGLVASQNAEFRDAVRANASYFGRDAMINGLINDIQYARALDGGNDAVGQALIAMNADSQRLMTAAAHVKEQAYSLQAKGWAKGRVGNSGATADLLLTSSRSGIPARGDLVTALQSVEGQNALSLAGFTGSTSVWESVSSAANTIRVPARLSQFGQRRQLAYGKEPIADQISTLAAYRILETDPTADSAMRLAMSDRLTSGCLNMANLNLQQCVAATHKQYEVPFCIGQHALADVGKCIGKVSE